MGIGNIYIEHDGEWYEYSHCAGQFPLDVYLKSVKAPDAGNVRTDKREFEIGSLVKFESLEDWTEVVSDPAVGACSCTGCVLSKIKRGMLVCTKRVALSNGGVSCMGRLFIKYTPETIEKPEESSAPTEGIKHDSGKLRPGLFPVECFEEISKVLTYGANKYAPDNWKNVSPDRYIDALWRHYIAWKTGEKNDAESGLSHAAHFATNAVFLLYFELEEAKKSEAGK